MQKARESTRICFEVEPKRGLANIDRRPNHCVMKCLGLTELIEIKLFLPALSFCLSPRK